MGRISSHGFAFDAAWLTARLSDLLNAARDWD
jgi:hypothetical protein